MNESKLLSVTLERFKCFEPKTRIEFAPLTIILGRNNSGKSTIIQSLLLLKQTLAEPRIHVPLHLDGVVSAFNLRELTFGWPKGDDIQGPTVEIEWSTKVAVQDALKTARKPDIDNLVNHANINGFDRQFLSEDVQDVTTYLELTTREKGGTTELSEITLGWKNPRGHRKELFSFQQEDESWICRYQRVGRADLLTVTLEHFIPWVEINLSKASSQTKQRAWFNAYTVLFAQPLEALRALLGGFQYLGSTREPAPSLYKSANVAPQEIGVSGELAAQLLHRRQSDPVHYLPPVKVTPDSVEIPNHVKESSFVDAVNEVLNDLSIEVKLAVEEIHEVGFRLLFGSASLPHVGRGLMYLLPLVELGLFADPLKFQRISRTLSRDSYAARAAGFSHLAIEECEAHLHPKVQSRLAHWLVSLAMSQRRLIVETHSDHLVRRLRGLVARAGAGTELERWLLENVVILEVEQDGEGRSTVTSTRLTAAGGIGEHWPAEFMDEASNEDSAIFYASLDKFESAETGASSVKWNDGDEPVLEEAP